MPMPKKLLERGITDLVRVLTTHERNGLRDGRVATSLPNPPPGELALVQDAMRLS